MRRTPVRRRAAVLLTATAVSAGLVASAQPSSAAGPTRFGAVVKATKGQTYQQALATSERRYGELGVIRYFDGNEPDAWSDLGPKLTDHDAVVSFRIPPASVLSGAHDDQLRRWFSTAPRRAGQDIYYSYMHEPEDNIARGEFTLADYLAAYRRIADIGESVGNPNLRSTLIMMCYTTNPTSKRNWRDYFAGRQWVDVIGWDCYNHGEGEGGYGTPEQLLGRVVDISRTTGVPYGIAELGSLVTPGDDGTGRGRWLKQTAKYLHANGAEFVSYFDTNGAGTDYRLLDVPSKRAWRSVVVDQTP